MRNGGIFPLRDVTVYLGGCTLRAHDNIRYYFSSENDDCMAPPALVGGFVSTRWRSAIIPALGGKLSLRLGDMLNSINARLDDTPAPNLVLGRRGRRLVMVFLTPDVLEGGDISLNVHFHAWLLPGEWVRSFRFVSSGRGAKGIIWNATPVVRFESLNGTSFARFYNDLVIEVTFITALSD